MERRFRHVASGIAALALFGAPPLPAAEQPEIRRPLPIVRPSPAPAEEPDSPRSEGEAPDFHQPAWMDRVAPTPPPQPEATPAAAETPEEQPFRPRERTGRVEVGPTPRNDEAGAIRIAPGVDPGTAATSEAQAMLRRADELYSRKMYDLAIPEYERFLVSFPDSADRPAALFRQAESQRFLDNREAARIGYERLLGEVREGEFAAAGAYRLAQLLDDDGVHAAAAARFEQAADLATTRTVGLAARFLQAQNLEKSKEYSRALTAYTTVWESDASDNVHRDAAGIAAARLATSAGDTDRALAIHRELAGEAVRSSIRAESAVKAAALLAEREQFDEARKLFRQAIETPDPGPWLGVARLGLLELDYQQGAYERVANLTSAEIDTIPGESAANALLLVGNANRRLGRPNRALEAYDDLMRRYPKSEAASKAGFHRLVVLFDSNSPALFEEINRFLLDSSNEDERAQAQLLKAEALFKAERFEEAADAYYGLRRAPLPPALKADAFYKLGWLYEQLERPAEAATAYSDLIDEFPDNALVPKAITQRGMAHHKAGAFQAAIRDFDRVIEEYPDAPEREIAMLQKALAYGAEQDYERMRRAFEALLEAYPESPATAQAEFWIGWSLFEDEKYAEALPRLARSRELDETSYGPRATLRIVLAHYYREDADNASREIQEKKPANLPLEVYAWLGAKLHEQGNNEAADEYLTRLAAGEFGGNVPPETWLHLGEARLALGRYARAEEALGEFTARAREPHVRGRTLVRRAEAQLGLGNHDAAEKFVEEALLLQPEGAVNAEARIMAGRVLAARGNNEEAARRFMTVAVLYDDPEITPVALKLAAEAYRQAGSPDEAESALRELEKRFPQAAPQAAADS